MKVFIAVVITESADTYVFAFKKKPTRDHVVELVHAAEKAAGLDFYLETCQVKITPVEVKP